MWDVLLNWSELVKLGGDAVTYFLMAAVGTILFLIRLVVALFGGDTGDFDLDPGTEAGGSDASFTLFSLLSVMAFIMGTGWMGLQSSSGALSSLTFAHSAIASSAEAKGPRYTTHAGSTNVGLICG